MAIDPEFVPYFIAYLLLFLVWFVRVNRQVMFWLYLWQLKEYHWGRFIDHFRTAKGMQIFMNGLFAVKVILLAAGAWFFVLPVAGRTGFFDHNSLYDFMSGYLKLMNGFIGAVVLVYAAEALYTVYSFLKNKLFHPQLTKKSVMLIAASHLAVYLVSLTAFFLFLGELRLLDLCFAAFGLLVIDMIAPVLISAVVLGLQPLTVREKNKIIARAKAAIENRPDLLVVGIAGSYGKSVTKELLAHILGQNYSVLKTQANQNTEMGVAQAVLNDLKPEHKVFVCEIGAVHRGKIAQTSGIVKPKVGILTGINQQHMAVFGSQKNIVDAKYEILEVLPASGTAILNWSSPMVKESFDSKKAAVKAQKIIFAGKDIAAADIKAERDALQFDLLLEGKKHTVRTNARGAFMVEPILLAVCGAMAAGMGPERIVEIINETEFAPFNIAVSENSDGVSVISSTYSANPDGVLAHLDYLKLWPGKKAIVMPCIIELGAASKDIHFAIGKRIGEVCDLAIITTKERFNDIKKGAVSAGTKPENIVFCDKPRIIKKIVAGKLGANDMLLVDGRVGENIAAVF